MTARHSSDNPATDKDVVGQRFGRLLVIEQRQVRISQAQAWFCVCRCDCSNVKEFRRRDLVRGHILTCGCYRKGRWGKHGGSHLPIYRIWIAMRVRCADESDPNYGGRGITVCDRWRDSFEAFRSDMGERPARHEIDRIDNNGNYEPGNCRWVTSSQNSRNTRVNRLLTMDGETRTLVDWADITGLPHTAIRSRLAYGWTVQAALTLPLYTRKGITKCSS